MHVAWVLNINYVHRHLNSAKMNTYIYGLVQTPLLVQLS